VQTNSYQKPLIQLEHVYYKYDDAQNHALEDINLSIYDGEHIALIGKSGAGKSTLAQVIAQHFKTQYGSVIYKQQLKIGFLSQHPYIFNASIRDNMTMFQKIDEDKILEALDDVNLKHVVNALENGIDTWIGEGGEMLSGGQMRRIELSRLLLLQPDVLIFDEPATGLDVQTEHVIQSVINKKFENTTIITIAHRENTIKNADRRIKINEGSVESIKVIKQNAYKGGDFC
jgi:ATP-binding cassette, subfamily C, bacterial CydD